MARLSLEGITVRYPEVREPTLRELDLATADGEFVLVIGAPHSGKSTLLRAVSGHEYPVSGRVLIGGQDVTDWPPAERDAVMVFQDYALYPHMDVRENMSFALRVAGVPKAERHERVLEAARLLDLTEQLAWTPDRLTGPQRQQIALARAVVRRPAVLLMDDPLATVPPELRDHTARQIRALARSLSVTTLYATAAPGPMSDVADRHLRLEAGRLREQAPVR